MELVGVWNSLTKAGNLERGVAPVVFHFPLSPLMLPNDDELVAGLLDISITLQRLLVQFTILLFRNWVHFFGGIEIWVAMPPCSMKLIYCSCFQVIPINRSLPAIQQFNLDFTCILSMLNMDLIIDYDMIQLFDYYFAVPKFDTMWTACSSTCTITYCCLPHMIRIFLTLPCYPCI